MNLKLIKSIPLILILLLVGGCASAGLVKERPDGGRVQVLGPGSHTDSGVKKAEAIILKKCPHGYDEVERGSEDSGAKAGTGYGGSVDMQAFFIEFKCKKAN